MVDLRLLGALDLTGPEGQRLLSVLSQPKRVALLAYLTVAGDFQRRDKLLALLWPESDPDHARNSLRQALHFLRRTLGAATLPGRGDGEIGVDPVKLSSDVGAFEAAIRRGDSAKALDLYRGDLLEGFFIPDAPDFERWVDEQRARLRGLAAASAWDLAKRAEQSGDTDSAVAWAQRSRTLAPEDEVSLRRVLELLARIGNRTTAVKVYQEFANHVQEEYQLEPSSETVATFDAIRSRDNEGGANARPHPLLGSAASLRGKPSSTASGHEVFPPPGDPALARPTSPRRWLKPLLAGAAAGITLLVGVETIWSRARAPDPDQLKTVAILPFRNLSGQTDNAYFTEGFQEELLAQLAKVRAFRVTARSSVVGYEAEPRDLEMVARDLGVRYLIQGSVQNDGGQVKISARLMDSATGQELWADTYERSRSDLFSIQLQVAERIAEALRVHFSPDERKRIAVRPTMNAAAYEAYLRGKVHWSRGVNREDAQWAVKFFEWAVVMDPQFAKAHAALAYSRVWLVYVFEEYEHVEGARRALDRAVHLAPDAVETGLAQGYYLSYLTRDYPSALERLSRVVQLEPSHAEALALMGFIQRRQGNWEEAAATMNQSLELDPHDYNTTVVLGEMLMRMRRLDEAERLLDRAITISPQGELAYAQKVLLYLYGRGDTAGAQRILDQAPVTFSARYRTLSALIAFIRRDYDLALELLVRPPRGDSGSRTLPDDLLLLGLIYQIKGRTELAAECADSIRMFLASSPPAQAASAVGSVWPLALARSYRALAHVLSDRPLDAISEAEQASALVPLTVDVHDGTEALRRLADIYALTGNVERATETMEVLLSMPSRMTTHVLTLHPIYDRIREDPRFQQMLSRYVDESAMVSVSVPISH